MSPFTSRLCPQLQCIDDVMYCNYCLLFCRNRMSKRPFGNEVVEQKFNIMQRTPTPNDPFMSNYVFRGRWTFIIIAPTSIQYSKTCTSYTKIRIFYCTLRDERYCDPRVLLKCTREVQTIFIRKNAKKSNEKTKFIALPSMFKFSIAIRRDQFVESKKW